MRGHQGVYARLQRAMPAHDDPYLHRSRRHAASV